MGGMTRQRSSARHQVDLPCEAAVVGTGGTLKLPCPMWAATALVLPDGRTEEFPLPETPDGRSYNFGNSAGLGYEARRLTKLEFNL